MQKHLFFGLRRIASSECRISVSNGRAEGAGCCSSHLQPSEIRLANHLLAVMIIYHRRALGSDDRIGMYMGHQNATNQVELRAFFE